MSPQIRLTQFLGRIEIKTADKIERVYFEIDENNIEQWEKPQIRESKKAFFYATITEGGDKEKLECYVDFCEDAIFEMQHAESLMSSADDGGGGGKKGPSGPSLPDEDQPRGIIAPLKESVASGKDAVRFYLAYLHPTSLAAAAAKAKTMTALELALVAVTSSFWLCYGVGFCVIKVGAGISNAVLFLMRGERLFGSAGSQKKKGVEVGGKLAAAIVAVPSEAADGAGEQEGAGGATSAETAASGGQQERRETAAAASPSVDLQKRQAAAMAAVERMASAKSTKTEPSAVSTINFGEYIKKVISFLARNFFTMKFIALSIAFLINFMLLFYKVSVMEDDSADDEMEELAASMEAATGDGDATGEDEGDGGEDDEFVHVNETYYYLEYIIRFLGIIHAVISLCMLIAYYNLKVPLAIFKREKEVARR